MLKRSIKVIGSSLIMGLILLLSLSAPALASNHNKIADISQYQGDINWKKASKHLNFVIIGTQKGSKGDPNYRIDTKYQRNIKGAMKNNVPFGQYMFGEFTSKKDARNEAKSFYKRLNPNASFYALDNEKHMTNADHAENVYVQTWYKEMRRLTNKPLVYYSGENFANINKINYDSFDGIWIANYGQKPKVHADLWQYTSNGHVKGIPNRVDLNHNINKSRVNSWFKNTKNEMNDN